mmetsp:Transcript_16694/g.35074  ORF Transcript_16694/g.35074 Transcript_16694/m.35074 type:complete len:93 (+) Transcript_16694:772-1050(+)
MCSDGLADFFTIAATSTPKTWKRVIPKKKKGGIGSSKGRTINHQHLLPRLIHANDSPNHNPTHSIPKAKMTPKQLQRRIKTLQAIEKHLCID